MVYDIDINAWAYREFPQAEQQLQLRHNVPLQLTASLWKLFEILPYEFLGAKLGFSIKPLV